MEERGRVPVGLPHSNPTTSYWQSPPDPIADLRTTPEPPAHADFVVIGSGISGTTIAKTILNRRPNASVVLLEARQACSGATGRNGGHTKPAGYRSFKEHYRQYGYTEAVRIARLMYSSLLESRRLVKEHGIQCDMHQCTTVDTFNDKKQWDNAESTARFLNDYVDGGVEKYTVIPQDEARRRFLVPDTYGAVIYDAGSVNSYKFTIGVLKVALEKGLNLQTNTPATAIDPPTGSSRNYTIHTPRGKISTPTPILATNGYTAHLLPHLQGIIVPLRGQITAQRPGLSLSQSQNGKPLENTYSFTHQIGYEYMITRPLGSKHEGDIVIGGGWSSLPKDGADEFGIVDDSALEPRVSAHLRKSTVAAFGSNWGADDPAGRVRSEWTGIMGTSADGQPYIGRIPGDGGKWDNAFICASFNGHGMSMCVKCAEATVDMVLGEEQKRKIDTWFPRCYRFTPNRLRVAFAGRKHIRAPDDATDGKMQAVDEGQVSSRL